MRTYEEGHGQGIEYKDEQELEEMCGIVRESDHPICADNLPSLLLLYGMIVRTYIEDTMIVGITRSGMTSKTKRDNNQAVGLMIMFESDS